jgi:hypothetical protein
MPFRFVFMLYHDSVFVSYIKIINFWWFKLMYKGKERWKTQISKVPISKVAPYFNLYNSIFYLKIFKRGKSIFWSNHFKSVWIVLNKWKTTLFLSDWLCDRTTSEMRGLSPRIISGDSRRSENAQTHIYKHTVSYMKFKLKLLQIKWHVLEFTQDKT